MKGKIANCEDISIEEYTAYADCMDALQSQMKQEKLSVCNKYFAGDETQKFMCHTIIARNLGDSTIFGTMPESFKQNCIRIVQTEQ